MRDHGYLSQIRCYEGVTMNSKFFYLLLCLSLTTHAHEFLSTVGHGIKSCYDFIIDRGRGDQARETVLQQTDLLKLAISTHKNTHSDESAKTTQEIAETNKENNSILKDGFDKNNNGNNETHNLLQKISDQLAGVPDKKKNGKFDQAEQILSMAADSTQIAQFGYNFGHGVYRWKYPDPKDKLRDDNAIKQLAILEVETQFNKCLVRNTDADKDNDGIPCKCRDISIAFGETAGQEALDKFKQKMVKRHLDRCLLRNMDADKDNDRMPYICKDISIVFGELMGKEALKKITQDLAEEHSHKALMQLNKCLAHNRDTEKEDNGLPRNCKNTSLTFEEAAGTEALKKILNEYNLCHMKQTR